MHSSMFITFEFSNQTFYAFLFLLRDLLSSSPTSTPFCFVKRIKHEAFYFVISSKCLSLSLHDYFCKHYITVKHSKLRAIVFVDLVTIWPNFHKVNKNNYP
jgi:hypothetical protein